MLDFPASADPETSGESSSDDTTPDDIGGYAILRPLAPGETFLATAPGGRQVVLKTLDADCLVDVGRRAIIAARATEADADLSDHSNASSASSASSASHVSTASHPVPTRRSALHPNIRDRLGRVRELAHAGVANLHGVERDGPWTYLVWEYLEGVPLDQWADGDTVRARDLLFMARELALAVEALHVRGIVHGAIRSGNVIVSPAGRPRLTHVSPLLYSDPAQDVAAIVALLQEVVSRRGELDAPLGQALNDIQSDLASDTVARHGGAAGAASTGASLPALVSRLTALIETRDEVQPNGPASREDLADSRADRRRRGRGLLGAAAVALTACGLYLGLRYYLARSPAVLPTSIQPVPAMVWSEIGGSLSQPTTNN